MRIHVTPLVLSHARAIWHALNNPLHPLFGREAVSCYNIKDKETEIETCISMSQPPSIRPKVHLQYERTLQQTSSPISLQMSYVADLGLPLQSLAEKIGLEAFFDSSGSNSRLPGVRNAVIIRGDYKKGDFPYVVELLKVADSAINLYKLPRQPLAKIKFA